MRAAAVENRLAGIAGAPVGTLTAPGDLQLPSFGAYEGRTLYVVYPQPISTADAWRPLGWMGYLGGRSELSLRTDGTGLGISARFDIVGSSENQTLSPGLNPDYAVTALWISQGLQVASTQTLGRLVVQRSDMVPGAGMSTAPALSLGTRGAPRMAVAYRGAHDDATRLRVMHKLLELAPL